MGNNPNRVLVDFLTNVFGDSVGVGNSTLVLWNPQDKRSRWCTDITEAQAYLDQYGDGVDVYFGVCLQDIMAALTERRRRTGDDNASLDYSRGYASTVSVVPGVWLDLDVAGPGHEKNGLPRSQADADRILDALPYDPTCILETGGGTHVYWLFHEPWVLETDEERRQAASYVRGWQQLAIDLAANMGFVVDATHDLSRVLRPCGTTNTKYMRPVVMRADSGHRFNPSDFEAYAVEVSPVGPAAHARREDLGDLREDLQPPADKLMAMLNLQPKFAETWRRQRKEFPSQSEYDMSLAAMAARAGWKDEEILALVVSHRREGNEPLRLDRPGYYTGLIGKARHGLVADEAHERLSERVEMVAQGDADIEEERDGFLTDVSNLLGFKIRRVLKFVTDPPQYRLVLDQGTIHLGGVDSILNSAKFRASIAAVSGVLIQRFQGARWDPVAQAILQAVEELDLGSDSSAEGLVDEWLGEYLTQNRPSVDRAEAIAVRHPFVDGDVAMFFLAEFRSWLTFHRDERLGRKQLATLLRSAGSEPRVVNYQRDADNKRSTVNVWTAPPSVAARVPAAPERQRDASTPPW